MLTGITWKSVPNFTQFGQELMAIRVGIDFLSSTVKCDCHWADLTALTWLVVFLWRTLPRIS